jgi:hypothetical protein
MLYGITEEEIEASNIPAKMKRIIIDRSHVKDMWLTGSRYFRTHHCGSDWDFIIFAESGSAYCSSFRDFLRSFGGMEVGYGADYKDPYLAGTVRATIGAFKENRYPVQIDFQLIKSPEYLALKLKAQELLKELHDKTDILNKLSKEETKLLWHTLMELGVHSAKEYKLVSEHKEIAF